VNVVLLNLRTDLDHTALGFTTLWINAIAEQVDAVEVITMHAGRIAVRDNVTVHSLARECGASRAMMVARFYWLLWYATRDGWADVCFAHMSQHLAILAWPVLRLRRIRLLLWYAHGAVPRSLRVAHRLADRCVTSTPAGLRVDSAKVRVLHQGIDTERFAPAVEENPGHWSTLVSIGRITASKRLLDLVDVLARLRTEGRPVRLLLVGDTLTDLDTDYLEAVRAAAVERGVADAVSFVGAVPFDAIADWYRRGGWFVNLSATGSLDKAILEAMASGCVPISSNKSFAEISRREGWHDLVAGEDAAGVAAAIGRLMDLPEADRRDLQRRLREFVVHHHSLAALACGLVDELRALAASSAAR